MNIQVQAKLSTIIDQCSLAESALLAYGRKVRMIPAYQDGNYTVTIHDDTENETYKICNSIAIFLVADIIGWTANTITEEIHNG